MPSLGEGLAPRSPSGGGKEKNENKSEGGGVCIGELRTSLV